MKRLLSLMVVLVVASAASADQVENLDFTFSPTDDITVYYDNQGAKPTATGGFTFTTGAYVDNANPLDDLEILANRTGDNPLVGYCIDLYQTAVDGETYDLVALTSAPQGGGQGTMSAAKATALAQMWKQFFADSLTNATTRGAFQLAVWEIIFEDWTTQSQLDVFNQETSTGFYATGVAGGDTGAIADKAAEYLGWDVNGDLANLVALTNGSKQDYVVEVPCPMISVQLLGLVAMFGLIRRRRKS